MKLEPIEKYKEQQIMVYSKTTTNPYREEKIFVEREITQEEIVDKINQIINMLNSKELEENE